MRDERKHYTAEEKGIILLRHLIDGGYCFQFVRRIATPPHGPPLMAKTVLWKLGQPLSGYRLVRANRLRLASSHRLPGRYLKSKDEVLAEHNERTSRLSSQAASPA